MARTWWPKKLGRKCLKDKGKDRDDAAGLSVACAVGVRIHELFILENVLERELPGGKNGD